MASDSSDFLFEDLVVESSLEFTLSATGSGDIHRGLSTTENDEILFGSNCGTVQGSIGDVGLHDFKVSRVDELCRKSVRIGIDHILMVAIYLGGLVFRRSDEVCAVWRPLKVSHLHVCLVNWNIIQLLAGLNPR